MCAFFRSQFLPRLLIPKNVRANSLLSEKSFQDHVLPQARNFAFNTGSFRTKIFPNLFKEKISLHLGLLFTQKSEESSFFIEKI
jgi:hypothetical protein